MGQIHLEELPHHQRLRFSTFPRNLNISQNRALKIDTNWTIKPNLINEGGFGFTLYTSGTSDSFNGTAWTNAQGWQGLQNLFYNGIPEMDFNNLQSLNADRLTSLTKSFTYDYSDVLIWTKGNHTLQVRRRHPDARSDHPAGLQRL